MHKQQKHNFAALFWGNLFTHSQTDTHKKTGINIDLLLSNNSHWHITLAAQFPAKVSTVGKHSKIYSFFLQTSAHIRLSRFCCGGRGVASLFVLLFLYVITFYFLLCLLSLLYPFLFFMLSYVPLILLLFRFQNYYLCLFVFITLFSSNFLVFLLKSCCHISSGWTFHGGRGNISLFVSFINHRLEEGLSWLELWQ